MAAHEKYLELKEMQGQDVDMVHDGKEDLLTKVFMDKGQVSDESDDWHGDPAAGVAFSRAF